MIQTSDTHNTIVKLDPINTALYQFSIKELAHIHLSGCKRPIEGGTIFSLLNIVLREIRHAKGYDKSKNFIPVVGAFAVIEQIGTAYEAIHIEKSSATNPIKKAIHYFSDTVSSSEDIDILHALRNSLVHEASLVRTQKNPIHFFRYNWDLELAVKAPTYSWNGNFNTFNPAHNFTEINPNLVIELAFEIVANAIKYLDIGMLEIKLEKHELLHRYLGFEPTKSNQ